MIYSWTTTSDFLTCPRKFQYKHVMGWNRQGKPSIALIRGSAVHAGLAAALKVPATECNSVAVRVAREWLETDELDTAKRLLENPPEFPIDIEGIYLEAWQEASAILSTYVPLLGLGTQWELAYHDGTPLVEIPISYVEDGNRVAGTFDAILRNIETGKLVMVDWKTRTQFPPAYAMICDGQLPFYASLWNRWCRENAIDMEVSEVAMVDLRVKIPSPASISVKNGVPNTGAATYDTTWETWVRTLPANIDPEKYRELMMPKLKPQDSYLRWNFFPVTILSERSAWDNFQMRVQMTKVGLYPPVYNAFTCQMCPFNSICGSFGRYNLVGEVPHDHQFLAAGFTHEPDTRYGEDQDE